MLEIMTPQLLKQLAATSAGLHKQIHGYVTSIALPHGRINEESHMRALVRGRRPMLRVLDLSNSNLNNDGGCRLVHGDWPVLTGLTCPTTSLLQQHLGC